MEIDAGRAPDKRQPLQPRCSHPGERERWGCHLLQIDVHWIVLVGGSAGRAEDDVAFPAGSELSQPNPGGFESMLGVFLSGFNVRRFVTSFSVLYVVKRILWRKSLRNDPKARDNRPR